MILLMLGGFCSKNWHPFGFPVGRDVYSTNDWTIGIKDTN